MFILTMGPGEPFSPGEPLSPWKKDTEVREGDPTASHQETPREDTEGSGYLSTDTRRLQSPALQARCSSTRTRDWVSPGKTVLMC